jgi:plasmid rolling circle replication initiator protein Rep
MSEKEKPLSDKALAAEITSKGSETKSIGEKLDKFTQAKHRQDVILNHLRDISTLKNKPPVVGHIDYNKTIAQISDCFNYLKFHDYYLQGENRLVQAFSCKKHLLCAPCAIRRASVAIAVYLEKFNEINALNSDLEPYMLTLTVKNGEDLQERFNHLQKSMKKIMKSRRNYSTRGTGFNEFCKIEGAVYSYELTHSAHGWHPHIHMIVLLKKGTKIDFNQRNPKASRLSKDWHKVTGDSFIVDVRAIYGSTSVQGFIEVFKYALKFSDLTPEQNLFAYSFLRSKRLQGSFGLFRGVEIPESLDEDPIIGQPFIELIYKYYNSTFNLAKQTHIEV